jgi:hypothetical protein
MGAPWVFVLQGLAETGKSTIAHFACRQAKERGQLGASFSRNDTSCSNPVLVFMTIAYRLSTQSPEFKSSLTEILKTDPDVLGLTLVRQLEKLVLQPICSEEYGMVPIPVMVFIDAVEECANYRAQILSLLITMRQKLPIYISFKLFVSFRPEHDLKSLLPSQDTYSGSRSSILHDVDASVVRSDIKRFLYVRLSQVAAQYRIDPGIWLSGDDISTLAEKSDKSFIFAATIAKFIGDMDDNPQSTLKSVMRTTQSAMKATCSEGPSPYEQLDRLYQ